MLLVGFCVITKCNFDHLIGGLFSYYYLPSNRSRRKSRAAYMISGKVSVSEEHSCVVLIANLTFFIAFISFGSRGYTFCFSNKAAQKAEFKNPAVYCVVLVQAPHLTFS